MRYKIRLMVDLMAKGGELKLVCGIELLMTLVVLLQGMNFNKLPRLAKYLAEKGMEDPEIPATPLAA